MTFKPSPTPWSLSKSGDGIWQIRSGDDYVGSCMYSDDMRHIVTAVNAYDKQRALIENMVAAFRDLSELTESGDDPISYVREIANEALAAAKSEGFDQ